MLVPQVLGSIRALFPSEAELAKALSCLRRDDGARRLDRPVRRRRAGRVEPVRLGWRTVFLAKLPIGIPVVLAAWLMVPETSASRRQRLDIGGAVLVSLALACLVLPLSEGRQQGWPAWTFVMLAAVPFLGAALPVVRGPPDRRAAAVRCSISACWRSPSFRRGVLVGTLFFFTTVVLRAVRDLPAGGLRHRPAAHRPRHPALRHRPVRRPAGHRAAGRGCGPGC